MLVSRSFQGFATRTRRCLERHNTHFSRAEVSIDQWTRERQFLKRLKKKTKKYKLFDDNVIITASAFVTPSFFFAYLNIVSGLIQPAEDKCVNDVLALEII